MASLSCLSVMYFTRVESCTFFIGIYLCLKSCILLNKISRAVHVKILSYRTLRLHLTSVSQQVGALSNYRAEVLVQAKFLYPREVVTARRQWVGWKVIAQRHSRLEGQIFGARVWHFSDSQAQSVLSGLSVDWRSWIRQLESQQGDFICFGSLHDGLYLLPWFMI